jgi:hypothetical protein
MYEYAYMIDTSIHSFSNYVSFEFFKMLSPVWPEDGFITSRNTCMLVNVCMFILTKSVKRRVNCNPQNGWYIRHYELAHIKIKSFTSAVRTSVLGTSTEFLSLWRQLSRLHSLSALSIIHSSTSWTVLLLWSNVTFIYVFQQDASVQATLLRPQSATGEPLSHLPRCH